MTTSLIDKIELLIKREKTTPDRKKDEPPKSSNEILSELFGAFNADPPKIEEIAPKKSKKSKKKHKKDKKKRSRSYSTSSSDEDSDYSHKRKRRKKSKSKKHRSRSSSRRRSRSPKHKPVLDPVRVKHEPSVKIEDVKVKKEEIKIEPKLKNEPKPVLNRQISIKIEDKSMNPNIDASLIPMPESPKELKEAGDLRQMLDRKKSESESDKAKGKIQIKNLKFSTVFEETVKKAEEEARKKAEKYEEGEYTDSSSESVNEVVTNSQFPKTSDPGGLKKAAEDKVSEDDKSQRKSKKTESSLKPSKRDRDRSKSKRPSSKSRRSRSRSPRKHRHGSPVKSRRSRSRHRSSSRSRRRSRSRTRLHTRHHSPRYRGRDRDRGRSPTGVKLADSEKKRLLEVARRNAINMLKNGAVPAGAAALPPHTRSQVMAAIQSGGKSVDELTDFCKHLSKKEALGELSSVSSHDDDMSENEDTLAFHHPFLVKEKAPIIMNIRGGAPLPIKANALPAANKDELRLQFPVSSGTQHRDSATEWRPVSPKKDNMQVAKLNTKHSAASAPAPKAIESGSTTNSTRPAPLALPAPPPAPAPLPVPTPTPPVNNSPAYLKALSTASQLTLPLGLPAPGPQAYPPKIDLAKIVTQKLQMIRKEQENNELTSTRGVSYFGWSKETYSLGQFTGSTDAHILTPRELASGTQAWAKKDQLQRAAPVEGGMGMHLLQKMGWTPGRGLGKEGTGTLQPLLLEVKLDTRGLQAKEEVSSRNNRGMKPQRGRGMRGGGGGGGGSAGGGVTLVAGGKHPVSLLGEYCSKQKQGPPEYSLCFECGPDHKKNFLFKVRVAGIEYQPAVASQNKKQAKADAAQLALQKLGILT